MKLSLLILIALFLLFIIVLRATENSMIYFPSKYPEGIWNPEDYGVMVEDVYFTTEDGLKLHGWFVPSKENRITMIWFHGNAGNLSGRLENIKYLMELNINVFIFDYRSYGKSEGNLPDEKTIYIDSRAAYQFLLKKKNLLKENLIFFGRSLGGAVAVEMAREFGCAGLIIESSFPSAKDMAQLMFPFLPVQYIMKTKFDSGRKIKTINCKKLFIHGNRDTIVPFELGKKLFDVAPEPKKFYEIEEADHNNTYIVGGSRYFEVINDFIRSDH